MIYPPSALIKPSQSVFGTRPNATLIRSCLILYLRSSKLNASPRLSVAVPCSAIRAVRSAIDLALPEKNCTKNCPMKSGMELSIFRKFRLKIGLARFSSCRSTPELINAFRRSLTFDRPDISLISSAAPVKPSNLNLKLVAPEAFSNVGMPPI